MAKLDDRIFLSERHVETLCYRMQDAIQTPRRREIAEPDTAGAACQRAPAETRGQPRLAAIVSTTFPADDSIALRDSASWCWSAERISAECSSHKTVLPSNSVNRKVTVSVGGLASIKVFGALRNVRTDCTGSGHALCRPPRNW
jgi:hypothetical protein